MKDEYDFPQEGCSIFFSLCCLERLVMDMYDIDVISKDEFKNLVNHSRNILKKSAEMEFTR